MKPISIIALKRRAHYLKLAVWIFFILFTQKFIIKGALRYFSLHEGAFRRCWGVKWQLVGYVIRGVLVLVIEPVQFWKAFRNQCLKVRGCLGRILLYSFLQA